MSSGEWPEGSRLPSEAELCREFDASRGTIRQALTVLRNEGLLTGGQGRPPAVARATQSQPFTTFMSFTEWASTSGRTPGQRTIEVARRGAGAETALHLELVEGDPVVELLRLRLLDGLPAMIERTAFVHEVGRRLFDFDPDEGSIFAYLTAVGVDLSRGRHTIDAVAADDLDAELLGVPTGSPLLRERRLTSTADGHPVEYSDDRYLPDLTNFTIENTREQRAALVRRPTTAA